MISLTNHDSRARSQWGRDEIYPDEIYISWDQRYISSGRWTKRQASEKQIETKILVRGAGCWQADRWRKPSQLAILEGTLLPYNIYICIYIYIYTPSGKQSYWKLPFIVDLLPLKLGFSIVMLVYQRVYIYGWWCNNHLEKYDFANGMKAHILWKIYYPCLKPPTR